jgi:hypothetical protein
MRLVKNGAGHGLPILHFIADIPFFVEFTKVRVFHRLTTLPLIGGGGLQAVL